MKVKKSFVFMVFPLVGSLVLSACGAVATPVAVPSIPSQPPEISQPPSGETVAELARSALSSQLNLDMSEVTISNIESADWPDSCLGIEDTQQICAKRIVPGYLIVLQANGMAYEYRANADGSQLVQSPTQGVHEPMAGYTPAQITEKFLIALQGDPNGESSWAYLTQSLKADLQSGQTLADILGIENIYRSFDIGDMIVSANGERAIVTATLNFVSPIRRDILLVKDESSWEIEAAIAYTLPPADVSMVDLTGSNIILDFLQALQDQQIDLAWGFIATDSTGQVTKDQVVTQAKGLAEIVPTSLTLLSNFDDRQVWSATLWVTPSESQPTQWQAGNNERWFELEPVPGGWKISQISATEIK